MTPEQAEKVGLLDPTVVGQLETKVLEYHLDKAVDDLMRLHDWIEALRAESRKRGAKFRAGDAVRDTRPWAKSSRYIIVGVERLSPTGTIYKAAKVRKDGLPSKRITVLWDHNDCELILENRP